MAPMRTPASIAFVCLLAALAVGCGSRSESTPFACLEGTSAYVDALHDAPGAVQLNDGTLISDCLTENQPAGDLATVGAALVEAATKLNAAARAEPGGDANLQLGYLLGAAQRGADRTEGIHADLIRRLAVAARYSPADPLPPNFLATYRQGFDAGHAHG
jgi:hypothetical protein